MFRIRRSLHWCSAVAVAFALASGAGAEEMKEGKVYASPEEAKPLEAGDKVPDSPLKDAKGEATSVHKLLSDGPIALVFYRGSWCPYCSKHLEALRDAIEPLKELGFTLVAVSPDSPENTMKAAEKFELPYTLVSDDAMATSKAFGIAFQSDYKHLVKASGGANTDSLLPVPSVFLIQKDGTVSWVHSDPNFKERLSAEDLLAAAKKTADMNK